MEENHPQSFEERIINYLRGQEIFVEDDFRTFSVVEKLRPEEEIGIILDEIVDKVINRILCKDRYENTRLWHNQYPLFDMSHIIPGFCIGKKTCNVFNIRINRIGNDTDKKSVIRHKSYLILYNCSVYKLRYLV